MCFRKYWMLAIVISVLFGSSGCGLVGEAGDSADVSVIAQQDQAGTVMPCEEGIFSGDTDCQAASNPDVSMDCFTWFYDCSEDGCSTNVEGVPVGFVPVSCGEWPCPTQNCGEGEEYEATCTSVPTCAPGQTCYDGVPVIAVPILGWGIIGCESTTTAASTIEYATNTSNEVVASTSTPTCDPEIGDGCIVATPTPTSTIVPERSATLTPTPYTFATNCGACMPTEIPDYDYINTWDEFTTLLNNYIEKYVYFPVTVYHLVNEYEIIAIWGDADNYNQVVWVQLQKDGSQRTGGFYPGMRVMVYGQISLDQGCTDDVSDGTICFPAVIGSSVAER